MSALGEENERQYRVVDQCLSMHAALRDRFEARARIVSLILLATSVLLCATVFAGDEILQVSGLSAGQARWWLGALSVVVFFLSLVEIRADFPARVRSHQVAVEALSALKLKFRASHVAPSQEDEARLQELGDEYARVMAQLPPIGERTFNRLKARHEMKRLVSQCISRYPGAPLWLVRLTVRLSAIRTLLRSRSS